MASSASFNSSLLGNGIIKSLNLSIGAANNPNAVSIVTLSSGNFGWLWVGAIAFLNSNALPAASNSSGVIFSFNNGKSSFSSLSKCSTKSFIKTLISSFCNVFLILSKSNFNWWCSFCPCFANSFPRSPNCSNKG
eukprot:NODE_779_length_3939_cov_0.376563.p4 type:complete len:135 gc:universal NODE_779_length_3939_cov_0.376563:546-950(+)